MRTGCWFWSPAPALRYAGVRRSRGRIVPTIHKILLSDNPIALQQALTEIRNAPGLGGPPAIMVDNEDRLINHIGREAHTAKKGMRDAL